MIHVSNSQMGAREGGKERERGWRGEKSAHACVCRIHKYTKR